MEKELSGAHQGHQKKMKRVENKDARQVCFSKRRNGLFKKASELATLCGAEVAILVYSPAGKPYTFGCPAVDPVINKFLSDNSNQPDQFSSPNNNQNPHQGTVITHLNQQYTDTLSCLDTEMLRRLMLQQGLKQAAKATPKCIWVENIEQLGIDQLEQLEESLCQIKFQLMARQNGLIHAGASSSSQLVNYFDPFAGMMTANVSFPNVALPTGNVISIPPSQMVCQHEPRMIGSGQPSHKPSSRDKFNMNVAPDEWLSENECSKTEECAPHSVGSLGSIRGTANFTGNYNGNTKFFINPDGMMMYPINSGMSRSLIPSSYRSEMCPINPVAVNHDPFIHNSFTFGYKGKEVETDKNYNSKPFLPLKPFSFTAQDQPIPNTGGTSTLKLGYVDLNAPPSGSSTNTSLKPDSKWALDQIDLNVPEESEVTPDSTSSKPDSK